MCVCPSESKASRAEEKFGMMSEHRGDRGESAESAHVAVNVGVRGSRADTADTTKVCFMDFDGLLQDRGEGLRIYNED